jgi:uncharacterized protein YjbJ (UPF0337 family)
MGDISLSFRCLAQRLYPHKAVNGSARVPVDPTPTPGRHLPSEHSDENVIPPMFISVQPLFNRRTTMKSSTQDNAEGKWHKVKGKIKQVAGKAVGNRDLEAEGKAENVDGKVQEKIAEIKAVVGK